MFDNGDTYIVIVNTFYPHFIFFAFFVFGVLLQILKRGCNRKETVCVYLIVEMNYEYLSSIIYYVHYS